MQQYRIQRAAGREVDAEEPVAMLVDGASCKVLLARCFLQGTYTDTPPQSFAVMGQRVPGSGGEVQSLGRWRWRVVAGARG